MSERQKTELQHKDGRIKQEAEQQDPGLYAVMQKQIEMQECMLCTVVEGSAQGEKLLFCGGRRVWSSASCAFLSSLEEKLSKETGSGILEEDGNSVFCEKFSGRSRLVVCGAGHVAIQVITLGKMLGFFVTVIEDRPMFCDRAQSAGADEVICDSFENGMERIQGGREVYVVIVTREHRYDQFCLEQILKKTTAYVGMMGSKKRVALVKEQLAQKGVDHSALEAVHTPIGLSIGAQTPEEIAVSILAEIIQVKNSQKRTAGYAGEILDGLLQAEREQLPCVMAVITARKGSVPRTVGTKMLIYRDGRTVGTIGGGRMESEVATRAARMLEGREPAYQRITFDITGKHAEEAMVCGGVAEVYLECVFQ